MSDQAPQLPSLDIQPGDLLSVRTATGEWRRKVADSEVEGYRTHEQRHDFVGVYVREPDGEPGDSLFWPIEDVRRVDVSSPPTHGESS